MIEVGKINLWDTIETTNIWIMRVPEDEREQQQNLKFTWTLKGP